MKKVVLVVLNSFKNDSRVLKESLSLKKAGYDVTVVALWEDGLKEFEKIQNISVHRVKLISKNWPKNKVVQFLKYLEFLYRVVKKYKSFHIFHCNDLNTLPVGFIVKKFFNKNTKIVYDAHEYEINDKPYESEISIKFKYILEKYLIKFANRVITVSGAIANEYERLYNIQKPALVLNAPPYKNMEKKDLFRKKFNIDKNTKIFLYQGGLSSGRGIETVLETFKTIEDNNIAVVFMGYGPLEELIKVASRRYDNIYFHSAVSPDILLDYTSSADFGISTIEDSCLSYRYCLPNKMFEYIMAEIPVIVSNLPEMENFVQKNKIGVVAKENTKKGLKDAIYEAIRLDIVELQKNIKTVKEKYNWEKQETVLLKIYEEL